MKQILSFQTFSTLSLSVLLALGLAACSPEFKRPDSGPTAKIRLTTDTANFISDRGYVIEWSSYEDEDCTFGQTVGFLNQNPNTMGYTPNALLTGNTESMIGYKTAGKIAPVERLIPAEKDFVFNLSRQSQGTQFGDNACSLSYVLSIQANQEYEITFSDNNKQCYLTVHKLYEGENGKITRLPYIPFLRKAKNTCRA